MALNRPYTFELAAIVLDEPGQHDDIKALAERNSPTDSSLTVWKLGQLAEAFYRS